MHRDQIVARCVSKTARDHAKPAPTGDTDAGLAEFVTHVIHSLQERVSRSTGLAGQHGRAMFSRGFTVQQVVHEYGNVCQSIMELASELGDSISVEEFRILNGCLDDGMAEALVEFSAETQSAWEIAAARDVDEKLGSLAHELRNEIHTATLAVVALRSGRVGLNGSTGALLDRCLIAMRSLIDRSLADLRVRAGMSPQHQRFSLAHFIADSHAGALLEAETRGCTLAVVEVDAAIVVLADREMLSSALGNLLQNAFKFTRPGSVVQLRAYAVDDRIRIEVADRCGGLPRGAAETMFLPFEQVGTDRSGMGLGLAISRRSVEANFGTLSVRDRPGVGCEFTIDLPNASQPTRD